MRFEIQNCIGMPIGRYKARFQHVSRVPIDDGFAVRLQFSIVGGQYNGTGVRRLVPELACPTNACGRLIGGLTGETVVPKSEVDIEPCLGRIYEITVEEKPDGTGTRVATVSPVEK